MKVLVTAASKHGATGEIADAIGRTLELHGVPTTVAAPEAEEVAALDGYDAVIVGSAVYAGRWLEPATSFVDRFASELRSRPVWLFSSGPVGDPPKPAEDPVDAAKMIEASQAREHRVFAGRLDKGRLGWGEKAIVVALRAPEGDFRDWDAIADWAVEIAGSVSVSTAES